jgi:hypothetical protein
MRQRIALVEQRVVGHPRNCHYFIIALRSTIETIDHVTVIHLVIVSFPVIVFHNNNNNSFLCFTHLFIVANWLPPQPPYLVPFLPDTLT